MRSNLATMNRDYPAGNGEPPLLDRLQWLVLGYDVPPKGAQAILDSMLAAPGDPDGELRLLEVYADLRAVSRPHGADSDAGADAPSPQHYLQAFLRSLDPSSEGLPDRFVASLERALRHYGIDGLERTAALEAASYRLFLARQRAATASASVRGILERRLADGDDQVVCDDGFRVVLDRLEAAVVTSEPGLAELAREVRWRLCDRPLIVKTDRHTIQSDRPVNMHHEGDLLSQAATAAIGRFSPAQEVILRSPPDGTRRARRWIEVKKGPR